MQPPEKQVAERRLIRSPSLQEINRRSATLEIPGFIPWVETHGYPQIIAPRCPATVPFHQQLRDAPAGGHVWEMRFTLRGPNAIEEVMTWAEICEDKFLATLPYRIETDRWGNLVMSPPPRSRHAEYQGQITILLQQRMAGGRSMTECPIQTSQGVKAVDVAWVSQERRKSRTNDPVYLIAPEICVEVESPANSHAELMERKSIFFEQGAQEFWLCNLEGQMTFFDPAGQIPQSNLCAGFPETIDLD